MKKLFFFCFIISFGALAQQEKAPNADGKFEQLGTMLPTPNSYRTASGAPGKDYWQQRADYKIKVILNDDNQSIKGEETITYYNQSPDALRYLWLQLDQNMRAQGSDAQITSTSSMRDSIPAKPFEQYIVNDIEFDGGFKISKVTDASGKPLDYLIQKTMMKIRLAQPLKPGENISFSIAWSYNINDRMRMGGRSGYEYFAEDGNYLYTVAQFFPRMAVYDDVEGWQHKQFIGGGEFALTFGNYEVEITVPSDHIVAASGTLQNAKDVLTKEELKRYQQAQKSTEQVWIVTEEEARAKEKNRAKDTRTWRFKADNVRDFAFASSRKFIWDAMVVELATNKPMAQSFYPKEGNPLWAEESTKAVANTLKLYSERTFDYPYPQATSVHAASIGMEYPMICFNFGRPRPDGTYSISTKTGMVYVIVHEVGHNYFPMIVNSDERQWAWMDEGLNSYLESQTMWEYYPDLPYTANSPESIIGYMKNKRIQNPIMTNPEQVLSLGPNAYTKPAAALNILRSSIMGPEIFDEAFKEYAQRWMFKHPTPADFFRTMEDASAFDLDWFWKGWFYGIDHVDISVDDVKWFKVRGDENEVETQTIKAPAGDLSTESRPQIAGPKYISVLETPSYFYGEYRSTVNDNEIIDKYQGKNLYEVKLSNKGGLVMPLILQFNFKDGSSEIHRIPAEIWRKNESEVSKVFVFEKELEYVVFDPKKELADVDKENNVFPRVEQKSKADAFKEKKG
jgi:hypothetical protein